MSVISLPTSWSDGQILAASALNGNFTTIVNDYNGSITNANISAAAAIGWTKISKSGSSIDDLADVIITSATSGQVLKYNGANWVNGTAGLVTYGGFISGTPAIANDLAINPRVRATATATRISAYSRTAPTGSSLTVQVYNVTQGAVVASVSITAGNNSATSTGMTTASMAAGDILRFDVTAIGSTVAGSNITIQIDGSE